LIAAGPFLEALARQAPGADAENIPAQPPPEDNTLKESKE